MRYEQSLQTLRRHGDWALEYARFLLKMGSKYPQVFLRDFPRWNLYVFLPGLTKPSFSPSVLQCKDVEQAVNAFYRDGFVVLSDALTSEETQQLKELVKSKGDEIVKADRDGTLPPELRNGRNRYTFDEFAPCLEWEYLAHNARVLAIVKAIWKGRAFRAVTAGGDLLFPGGTWQPLHNDNSWNGAGESPPRVVTVNFYVSDVLPSSGPVRQVPGTARFPVPNGVLTRFEPQWMKQALVTGKAGYAVIRDQRAWHGGTPNTSTEPRYMPNLTYVLRDAPLDQVGGTQALKRLRRGEWIAEFENP
jgi:hypothetical protein